MHRNLTVREVLFYQAKLRLPAETDTQTINKKIRQVLLTNFKLKIFKIPGTTYV